VTSKPVANSCAVNRAMSARRWCPSGLPLPLPDSASRTRVASRENAPDARPGLGDLDQQLADQLGGHALVVQRPAHAGEQRVGAHDAVLLPEQSVLDERGAPVGVHR